MELAVTLDQIIAVHGIGSQLADGSVYCLGLGGIGGTLLKSICCSSSSPLAWVCVEISRIFLWSLTYLFCFGIVFGVVLMLYAETLAVIQLPVISFSRSVYVCNFAGSLIDQAVRGQAQSLITGRKCQLSGKATLLLRRPTRIDFSPHLNAIDSLFEDQGSQKELRVLPISSISKV
ncbi:hypothetical protein IHE45_15G058400 [Dioscorea alata]|uniref:Uncharacterized protein n=1 Tax=Dioscorea alata TaxID=55571 RepID=A0ACB7ULH5_DIOAL|nr:hypothetical protein IHE45_15G058400 [Dioscorea alata]